VKAGHSIHRRWGQVLLSGIVVLYALERALVETRNLNLVPSVIMLGAFLVPTAFVIYLYERLPDWEVPIPAVWISFLWGGALGIFVASLLEYKTLRTLGFVPMLGVGLIEEAAKLILPLAFYVRGRYLSQAAGIILGVASGMGFAALETMGYAFVTLLRSGGNLAVLDEVLLVRGLLSPAGHAAWTGMVAAVLWKERERGRPGLSGKVVAAFVLAVVLHALWDTFNGLREATFLSWASVEVLSLLVAGISLVLLLRRVRESSRSVPS
jgi:RsiW-degrading membrane proteinase PrsW (M82 family)